MKTLFILNNPALIEQCQSAMADNDGLILIEDAVKLSTQPTSEQDYFVLEEDLIARNLKSQKCWIKQNYEGFVDLTLTFDKTVSWL